jgi:hypothetical protein
MPDQISALEAEFREASARARALVEGLGPARITQRPRSGGWSVAECLEHLNLTTRAFLPLWRDACLTAPPGNGPYSLDLWGRLLVWLMEPPSRMKMPTTSPFQPTVVPAEAVLPDFLACQEQLLSSLSSARGRRIDQVKIASPFNRRMRYNVYSSFCIGAAHQRRHLGQAELAVRGFEAAH